MRLSPRRVGRTSSTLLVLALTASLVAFTPTATAGDSTPAADAVPVPAAKP